MSVAKPICNMCHKEMVKDLTQHSSVLNNIYVCAMPSCPNFSLLQIDEVTMYKISKKGKE